jgi:hypothetical protein
MLEGNVVQLKEVPSTLRELSERLKQHDQRSTA